MTPPTQTIDGTFRLRRPGFDFDVAFSVPDAGVTAIFGESGSGKTTLLRCVAGLEHDPRGRFAVGSTIWQGPATSLPTHRRELGVVFQDARLLPHLSVQGNLDFATRRAGRDHQDLDRDIVDLTGIAGVLDRWPQGLSGGERRRAAIAVALMRRPRLLLLDEPLTGLDHAAKEEIMTLLEDVCEELGLPVLYVSHDPNEIARLADHLLVMRDGRIVQSGNFFELVNAIDGPLADRDDAEAVLVGTVRGLDEAHHLTEIDVGGVTLWVTGTAPMPGHALRVRIRARDVSLAVDAPKRTSILNVLPATVTACRTLHPGQCAVALDLGRGTTILSRITERSVASLGIRPGLEVFAQVKSVALLGPGRSAE